MSPTTSKIGHGLAKALGIKLEYRNELGRENITRGESVFSVSSADTYVEEEPTVAEWFRETLPNGQDLLRYGKSLFPFVNWLPFYNTQWLVGDLVAGITVGAVVVPQGMAYAQLAELPVYYGLYSSFMGVLIYWIFATSKDITIGPVAVMSTITGNVVLQASRAAPQLYQPNTDSAHIIASALAIIAGGIVCFIGLARLGWIVNFISLTSISAFMTGSAISIGVGQVPALMGITGFSTRDSPYLVVIHTLQHLGRSSYDAAIGLTCLTLLYGIRFTMNTLAKRMPNRRRILFFMNTLRTVFVILLYTLISWLVNRNIRNHNAKYAHFKILGTVPRGFRHAGVPTVTASIIKIFASQIPASVIVLLIEHISIAKSFGRVNGYQIDPSQELVAIGVTNLLAPFLGGFPSTGSFSRTAIKSKAGVRTPLAGVITAVIVLLAIYALPAVFFYIPNAALAAVIIHAVGDLITPPNVVYQFWRVSPLEVPIFFAGVFVTVFSSIENGIYTTICVSVALLLYRVVMAQGRFMGRVAVHSVVGDHVLNAAERKSNKANSAVRNIFIPVDHQDGSNPSIDVKSPYPGIFMYRFSEGYNYPNASHYLDYMTEYIFATTRRTNMDSYGRLGDRPWNDPGTSRSGKQPEGEEDKPTLKAIILDFSSVNNVDITSIQHLIDVRNQLDRYASPEKVQWHIACINNRWTKRALASAGFGFPTPTDDEDPGFHRWKPIFSVAEMGGSSSAAADAEYDYNKRHPDLEFARARSRSQGRADHNSGSSSQDSIEKTIQKSAAYKTESRPVVVVHGLNRPLFHIDLTSALQSAIANAEHRPADVSVEPESIEMANIANDSKA